MVEVWVRLIESMKKTLDDCPAELREEVRERLIEDGWDVGL